MLEYVVFSCRCGRELRVKADLAGTTVHCWSCQAEVLVPKTKRVKRLARGSFARLQDVLQAEVFLLILLGALVVSCALAIPVVGAPAGLAGLTAAAMAYREVILRSGLQGTPLPEQAAWRSWAVRGLWGLVVALGVTAPVLLRHAIMDAHRQLIPLRGAGVAAAAFLGWIVIPLVVLIFSASDRSGALTLRAALAAVRRHPVVTLAGLLIVPAGLLLLEATMVMVSVQQGWFQFLMLDLFPTRKTDWVPFRATLPYDISFPEHQPLSVFFRTYFHGLRLGYTLIGTIPASIPRFPDMRVGTWFALSFPWLYFALKVLFTTFVLSVFAFLLAIQARWLGLIPTLDADSNAADTRSTP